MSEYVIKNCPATYQNFEEKFVCTSQIKEKGFPCYCQDCPDCVMKKIVEKCRDNIEFIKNNNLPLITATTDNKIIKMLDIEECE